jgi:SNF family Na+-dependent transporter
VGYGSFWRFPYLVYEHGTEFIFIYFIILLLFGLPILYLEATLGQIHQLSMPFIFSRINRGFKALGLCFVLVCFHFSAIYNIILAYSYRYVLSVFDMGIRFEDESIKDNKIFGDVILHSSDSINDFGGINWSLFFFYLFSLGMCYFIVRKGVKQSGKIIVFTAIFPYVLFVIMLIRGLFLPGAM